VDVTAIQPVRLQEIVTIPDSTRRERFAVSANQTLDGQVVSVEGDTVIVSIGQQRVPAQANPGTTLRPGEAIRLFVRDVDPDQVIMQIVARGASMQTMRSLTTEDLRAELTSLGVTPDDQAVEVARALINRGLPVTAQNVLEVRAGLTRLGAGAGAAELDAAVFLKSQGLPITADGVQIVRQALQSRSALGSQVEGLRTALADLAFRLTAQGVVPAPRGPIVTISPTEAPPPDAEAATQSTLAGRPAAPGPTDTPRGPVPGAPTSARAGPDQATSRPAVADAVEPAAPAPSRPAGAAGESAPPEDAAPRPAAGLAGGPAAAPADVDAALPVAAAPNTGAEGAPAIAATSPEDGAPPPTPASTAAGAPATSPASADAPPPAGAPPVPAPPPSPTPAAPTAAAPGRTAALDGAAAALNTAAADLDAVPAPGQGPGGGQAVDGAPRAAAPPPSPATTAAAGAAAEPAPAPEPSLARLLANVVETLDRLPLLDEHAVEAGADALTSEIRRVIADQGTPVEAKLARVLEGLAERGDLERLLATDLKSSLQALVRETQAQLATAERLPADTARDLRSVGQQAEGLLGQVELQQLANAAAGPDGRQPSYLMFQLPIPGGREPQTAQIRIKQESDGRTARIDPKNVHVVFQLELQNLHTVRVGIRVVDRHLVCQMGSSDPTATELLAQHAPELREGLSGLGYLVEPIQTAVLTPADLLPAAAEPTAPRGRPAMRVDARA
jgi:hypothetical protein